MFESLLQLCLSFLNKIQVNHFIGLPICLGFLGFVWNARPEVYKKLGLVFLSTEIFVLIASQIFNLELGSLRSSPWAGLNMRYHVAADGFSWVFMVLTVFMTGIVFVLSDSEKIKKSQVYLGHFLILQGILIGLFTAQDALLFYIFWEASLIPLFFVIGIWGGQNRIYASVKLLLFTFVGSIVLLVAFIYLQQKSGSFSLQDWSFLKLGWNEQKWLFWALLLGFAVKIPMWPLHTWLPDAHAEAPTGGSIMLAAVLLKLGVYAMLKILLPILPEAAVFYSKTMILLSLIAVVYVGAVAVVQPDLKKLVAYSSIAHMGMVTLGIFLSLKQPQMGLALNAIQGAVVQMISHGIVSAGLFACVGILYDRHHSRLIRDYGGLAQTMPRYSTFFMIFVLGNLGLPLTSGFVGEIMILLSAYHYSFFCVFSAGLTLIFSAVYSLWMYKRVIFGRAGQSLFHTQDIARIDQWVLGCLAALVLGLGVWPEPFLKITKPASDLFVRQVYTKLNRVIQ